MIPEFHEIIPIPRNHPSTLQGHLKSRTESKIPNKGCENPEALELGRW